MATIVSPSGQRASGRAIARIVGASRRGPFVLTCEHAGAAIPWTVKIPSAVAALLRTHRGSDRGAWPLTRALALRLDAVAIGSSWSRLWIDLNRRVDDSTLILAEVDGVAIPWNRALNSRDIERRARDYHDPYHTTVDRTLRTRLAGGSRPMVFSIHTFTPVFEGTERRFDVGILFDRHDRPARRLATILRRSGLSVRLNEPYSGKNGLMYAAERHGSHYGLVCLELEVNQARFDDAKFVGRLTEALAPALSEAAGAC